MAVNKNVQISCKNRLNLLSRLFFFSFIPEAFFLFFGMRPSILKNKLPIEEAVCHLRGDGYDRFLSKMMIHNSSESQNDSTVD